MHRALKYLWEAPDSPLYQNNLWVSSSVISLQLCEIIKTDCFHKSCHPLHHAFHRFQSAGKYLASTQLVSKTALTFLQEVEVPLPREAFHCARLVHGFLQHQKFGLCMQIIPNCKPNTMSVTQHHLVWNWQGHKKNPSVYTSSFSNSQPYIKKLLQQVQDILSSPFRWVTTIIKLIISVAYGACWICLFCHNPQNSDMDYRIFIMHTDVNACDCTWGCRNTARESALKVDSEKKIPCCIRESNLRQGHDGEML